MKNIFKNRKKAVIAILVSVCTLTAIIVCSVTAFAINNSPVFMFGQRIKVISDMNDTSVVATIGSTSISKKDFDTYKALLSLHSHNVSNKQVLDKIVEREVWYNEALKHNSTVSDHAVDQMVSTIKATIEGNAELSKELHEYLSGIGFSDSQYWERAKPLYKKAFIIGNYKSSLESVFKQKNHTVSEQDLANQFDAYCNNLTNQFKAKEKIKYFIKYKFYKNRNSG